MSKNNRTGGAKTTRSTRNPHAVNARKMRPQVIVNKKRKSNRKIKHKGQSYENDPIM